MGVGSSAVAFMSAYGTDGPDRAGWSHAHSPGPLRAVVGLAATAADDARQLPGKAFEFPMLVVSTALQASLRAQQQYAA